MKQHRLFSTMLRSLAICLALLSFLWLNTTARAGITITVTTTSDEVIFEEACSLREAIQAANTNTTVNECYHDGSSGTDTIVFDIPGVGPHTIQPTSALPAITEAVIIDGYTQSGAAANTQAVGSDATLLIELDGSLAGASVSGLNLSASNSAIRGLVINRFSSVGIVVTGSNNTIEGNYIGTDVTGTIDRGNSVDGIIGGSPGTNNTIGGSTPAARNILSGNDRNGITLDQVNGYYIYGNYIGPDATGAADLGNTGAGIGNFQGSNHQIGGTSAGQSNVISGNNTNGVEINGSSAQNNNVQGNFIGTTATGTASLGNSQSGVALVGSTNNNTIGGTTAAARNLISGNGLWGVFLSVGVNNNFIQGNFIGTDVTGQLDLGNGQSGVEMQNAPNNTIGGTTAGAGNLISGNQFSGVFINQSLSSGNTVQGNLIGTDIDGIDAIPNNSSGISLNTANNIIGGTAANAGNLISGNNLEGIFMSGTNATGNTIQGNLIGTDSTGTASVANGQYGIRVYNGPSNNTIGGTSANARNLVSGNLFGGINLEGADTTTNTINGNYIGTDISGSADLGNGFTGIGFLSTGPGNIVGEVDGGSNLIAFNGTQGVYIAGSSPTIQANTISDNGFSGIAVVVDYGTDRSPATAADDLIAQPILGGSPDSLNDIDNNCTSAPGTADCAGILLLDTAPANGATLETDNSIGTNNGRNDVEQRWYGALEISNGEVVVAESATITSSSGGPSYTMDQNDACTGGVLDNTIVHGVSASIDCDDVSTWTKFLEFIVPPTGPRETYTPQSVNDVDYSFDGDATTDPTDSGVGFGDEGITTGAFSRYQIMEISQDLDPAQTGPIFTVNTSADSDDGTCTVDDCSLREAIDAANATANGLDPDEIHFDLSGSGVQTITPNTPLPDLTEAVIIDGLTQSGADCTAWPPTLSVELDGTNAAESVGLLLTGNGSTIRGLVINNFPGTGLSISSDNNTAQCNFIGVDADGTTDQGNDGSGVLISGSGNLIGGPASENGNLIAYNNDNGITVNSGTGNALRSNRLLANDGLGIDLADDGVTDNDLDDVDSGPNDLQNHPVLYRAVPSGSSVVLEGRINGAANTTYELDVFLSSSCDPSDFGEGETFLGSGSVSTDAEGNVFFIETLAVTVPNNQYVTATATDPSGNTSELSGCVISGPDNDSWPRALTLSGNPATFEQFIDQPDQARWYKFSVTPNSQVQITLSNLPNDYDLLVFKDIAQAFEELNSSEDLQRLGAEFAPDAFSPSSFSPSSFSPSSFSPSSFSPSSFSPSSFSPSSFSPSSFSPSSFSPSSFSPSSFSPSSFSPSSFSPSSFSPSSFSPSSFSPSSFSPSSFSSAQTRSILGASAFEGTGDETITLNTWNNTGDFYIRIRGKNGNFNLSNPFQIEVTTLETSCDLFPAFPATSLTATDGDYETIIIVDESRLDRMDGTDAEKTAMLARLQDLAAHPAVNGVVVNVGPDARVSAANAEADDQFACPYAKNIVANAIKAIIDDYRELNPLEYIVIIGDDDIIPFYRYPDNALLGNEENYVPPVRDDTPSQASLRLGYVLSQEQYGAEFSISVKGNDLPIPNLAIGRLVETATEITGMLDAFIDETNNGVVDTPASSLVTGYDFLEDAALAVQEQLEAGTGNSADTLIVDQNLSPLDPAAWTAADLGNLLLNNRYDIAFLAGHFSANSALAADYSTSLITTDLTNSAVDMTNALFFSAGCHSGYNIVNPHGIPGLTFQPDWAQAFAQKRATLIAGTGYQYGDTDFIEYGERLYLEFSRQLRVGTDPVPIGQALVRAKQLYLETTPQLRGLHEKTVLQTTIFGLPMLSVDLPAGRITESTDSSIVTSLSAFTTDPGNTLGLEYTDITIVPSFTTNTLELDNVDDGTTVTATYLSGSNGLLTNAAEPALPLEIRNVTAPNGKVLRGFAFRGGDYTDLLDIIPLTGAPTTEIRGVHTPFISDVFYPIRPYNANYFGALFETGSGATRLVVTPAQFRSTAPGSQTNTLRRFDQMAFRLYYSDNITNYGGDSIPALAAPPAISQIQGTPDGSGNVDFSALVVGNPAAGIQEVWVTYTAVSGPFAGQWQSLDLTQNSDDSTRWEGTLPLGGTPPEDIRYIVQAVNGVGLVTLMDNLGAFYIPMVALASQTEPPAPTELALESPPTSGSYSTETTVTARLTSNGTPLANQPLVFGLGQQTRVGFTDSEGRATVNIPLLILPGSYSLKATFLGTADFASASDQTSFAVVKQGTNLSLETPNGPDTLPIIATLTDADGRPLLEQTIIFVVSGPNGSYSESIITNLVGQAALTDIPLPGGDYTITAYFNGEIPVSSGTVRLANSSYDGTTASTALTLAQSTGSLTIAKVAIEGFSGDFGFTGDLGVFTLTTSSALSQTTFTDLAPDTYTITEDPATFPSGNWLLIGVSCVDTAGDQPQSVSISVDHANYRADIPLAAGQQLLCTFFNEPTTFEGEESGDQATERLYLPFITKE